MIRQDSRIPEAHIHLVAHCHRSLRLTLLRYRNHLADRCRCNRLRKHQAYRHHRNRSDSHREYHCCLNRCLADRTHQESR